jgi:uncharacterized protein YtpQ (UPF0354 family)
MSSSNQDSAVQSLSSTPLALPRIKNIQMLDYLQSMQEMTEDSMPLCQSLVGDLILTFALDMGDSYMTVSKGVCDQHNISLDDLPDLALSNAVELLRDIKVHTDGTIYELQVGHDMEACTILFPSLWAQIAENFESDVLAIFPHRNHVFYAPSNSEQGKVALLEMLQQTDFSNDTHALSKKLYLFSQQEWAELLVD